MHVSIWGVFVTVPLISIRPINRCTSSGIWRNVTGCRPSRGRHDSAMALVDAAHLPGRRYTSCALHEHSAAPQLPVVVYGQPIVVIAWRTAVPPGRVA